MTEKDIPHHANDEDKEVRNTIDNSGVDSINTCRSNLDKILDAVELRYFGNRDALSMLTLSALSAHTAFTIKLHIALIGGSDVGKTGAMSAMRDMLTPAHKYETMKVTPKVMYYQANDGLSFNNVVVALDDITDGDTEILKNIANSSNTPPSFSTLVNQKPLTINFDAQPVVWTSKVELLNDHDGQADRRFFTIEILPNDAVRQFIFDKERKNADVASFDSIIEAKKHIEEIMTRDQLVEIPEHDVSHIKRNSDMNFYIAMIRSIAKINTDDVVSKTITASHEDIREAQRLYRAHIVQTISIKQNTAELLAYVPSDISECDYMTPSDSINSIRAIYNAQKMTLKLSSKQVRTKLKELNDCGLIEETSGVNRTLLYCTFDECSSGLPSVSQM